MSTNYRTRVQDFFDLYAVLDFLFIPGHLLFWGAFSILEVHYFHQ